ncbi:hypothetical protein ACWE42_11135 [Sutcliffiella cohnii]
MKVTDWVEFLNKKEYRGFIVHISEGSDKPISVRLCSPLELANKVILVNEEDICLMPPMSLHQEDINSLIDLALYLKDEKWFNVLTQVKQNKF